MICCAVGGVQAQTLTVHRQMSRYGVPRVVFINKMDRVGGDAFSILKQIERKLRLNVASVQVPIGCEAAFEGVVDVIGKQGLFFDSGKSGIDQR